MYCRKSITTQLKISHEKTDRNWSKIVPELLGLIFKRLILSDQLRFSCVCKAWFLVAGDTCYPPLSELPWLMLDELEENGKTHWKFYSLTENRFYKIDKRLRCNAAIDTVFQTSSKFQCWLGLTSQDQEGSNFHLTNPFIKVRINQLPELSTLPFMKSLASNYEKLYGHRRKKTYGEVTKVVVYSPAPVSVKTTMVALLYARYYFAMCRLGDDKWSSSKTEHYWDIIFYNEKLFAARGNAKATIDIYSILLDELPCCRFLGSTDVATRRKCISNAYFVESCGDLLIVLRDFNEDLTTRFDVYKLELSSSTSSNNFPPKCIKMKSLGDQALFLGFKNSLSLPAKDFPQVEKNCIYSTCLHYDYEDGLGVFSMEDDCLKPFLFPVPRHGFRYAAWIAPIPELRM